MFKTEIFYTQQSIKTHIKGYCDAVNEIIQIYLYFFFYCVDDGTGSAVRN
jgi:hypothetical protein